MATPLMFHSVVKNLTSDLSLHRLPKLALWFFILPVLLMDQSVAAQDRTASLKAAYLYYFTKFVYWPTPSEIRNICMYGTAKDIKKELKKVELKANGNIKVSFINEHAFNTSGTNCDLAFIVDSQWSTLSVGAGTLLVSDETIDHPETVVQLLLNNNKLTFDINRANAKKKNLEVSAKLLGLAREVND